MNAFVKATENQTPETLTENGAVTYTTSANKNVDLFFAIGALRGQGSDRLTRLFEAAYQENPEYALRILSWVRDVRGGAGERQIFRDVLRYLEVHHSDALDRIFDKIPEIGRWDDLQAFQSTEFRTRALEAYAKALTDGHGLAAKWAPRKGEFAEALRAHMGLTPKKYRKLVVNLTQVVETAMCAKDYSAINYSHVPSVAAARYRKAFYRNDEANYKAYVEKLKSGDKTVKVNAGAVYPYDVLKTLFNGGAYSAYNTEMSKTDRDFIVAQWEALQNFLGNETILPVVDVSGSMYSPCGGNLTCIEVAVSLGLYLADKQTGPFAGMYLSFSDKPVLSKLKGDVVSKVKQMLSDHVGFSTNLEASFAEILKVAKAGNVPQEDMPAYVVVLSDMEFNAFSNRQSALRNIRAQYAAAGYELPKLVWWNIQSRQDNVPVRFDQNGNALISGFSPSIMKSVLAGRTITPEGIMLETIMQPRYDLL